MVNIKNKKANFDYIILDTYVAGIVLFGSEVKSIRNNECQITESYCYFGSDGLYIKNMYIAEFTEANINNHETTRDRKLLLNKKELQKIQKSVTEKGTTLIPLNVFITDTGFIKLSICIAKGKNKGDKRNSLKESDSKKEIDSAKKKSNYE